MLSVQADLHQHIGTQMNMKFISIYVWCMQVDRVNIRANALVICKSSLSIDMSHVARTARNIHLLLVHSLVMCSGFNSARTWMDWFLTTGWIMTFSTILVMWPDSEQTKHKPIRMTCSLFLLLTGWNSPVYFLTTQIVHLSVTTFNATNKLVQAPESVIS